MNPKDKGLDGTKVALDWGLASMSSVGATDFFLLLSGVREKKIWEDLPEVEAAELIEDRVETGPATCVFRRGCHVHLLIYSLLPKKWERVEAVTML